MVTEKNKNYARLMGLCLFLFLTLFCVQISWLISAYEFQKTKIHSEILRVMNDIGKEMNALNYDVYHSESRKLTTSELNDIEGIIDSIFQESNINNEFYFAIYSETKDSFYQTPAYPEPLSEDEFRNSKYQICLTCFTSFSFVDEEAKKEMLRTNSTENIQSKYTYYSTVESLAYRFKGSVDILWFSILIPNLNMEALKPLLVLFLLGITLTSIILYFFTKIYKDFANFKTMSGIKEDFINNITHEFKTPLSSIRLASRVLRKSTDKEKNKTYHNLIEKESDNLEQQIDRLLELSLIDHNEIYFDKEKIDLHEIIQEVIAENELNIKSKSATIHTDFQLEDAGLYGDGYHLKNSFKNLLENALKYGGPNIDIYINSQKKDAQKLITIRDTGYGISEEDKKNIFERFYRGQKKNQYKEKGFGIGLSYVKSIIEEHGGSINLNPNTKSGTEFIIKFDSNNE